MPEPAYSEQSLPGGSGAPPETGRTPPSAATFDIASSGDRMRVTVHADLGPGDGHQVSSIVQQALGISVEGIDLDLSAVESCDSSGVYLLLDLRRRAFERGKTVIICSSSPAVERRLDLTGIRTLFAPPSPNSRNTAQSTDQDAPSDHNTAQDPHAVNAQLRRAIQTRPIIDLARGILMVSFGLSPDKAWDVLVTTSQKTNTKLHRLAEDVVGAVHGPALSKAVREQLAAAAVKATAESPPRPARNFTPGSPGHH
ncbi:hypothetical protein GCM10010361_42160 [Streptomyces olivaceiscleroticus]|uniref:Antitermination regulator n=1 Tax=Streptomyces olivaceiscleroticus TaxID=68245 RepID=A0ABN1AD72_9ACTN